MGEIQSGLFCLPSIEFAANAMAKLGASATKIMRRQVINADCLSPKLL